MGLTEAILSTLPGNVLGNLRRAEDYWAALRNNTPAVPTVVTEFQEPLDAML